MTDVLTPEQRSYCMSRIRGKDTGIETAVRAGLHREGLRFRKHTKGLPGRPDVVFPRAKVAVFLDGDFWHGYRFPRWEGSLSEFWRNKIDQNRQRDERNFRRLRSMGYMVIRLWEHQIEKDLEGCVAKVSAAVRARQKLSTKTSANSAA